MQLLCIGDVALADKTLPDDGWEAPGGIVPGNKQRVLFNWELAMGNVKSSAPRSRGRRLLAHPDSWRIIQKWSPGFAAMATNHILDAGDDGLANTIGSLTRVGFTTVGAGQTQEEIAKPLIWETAEGRLAIVNWVFPETHPDWMAVPGPNCWPGPESAKRTIEDLKRKSDWVLIVVHWSDELFSYPRPEDRAIACEMAGMGADFVVGHHPHVVRGMEIIGSCPVFYSIGNFYFSQKRAPRNRAGLGVQITLRRGQKPEYRMLSFWQKRGQVVRDPLHRAARQVESASQPLHQFQGPEYARWYDAKQASFRKWAYRWHFALWNMGQGDWKRVSSKYLGRVWVHR